MRTPKSHIFSGASIRPSAKTARTALVALAFLGGTLALWLLPTIRPYVDDTRRARVARVVAVDNADLLTQGLVEFGTQHLTVDLKGVAYKAENEMRGQLELDKKFAPGDKALVIVPPDLAPDSVLVARDHWRLGWGGVFFAAFAAFLCLFGGWVGAKALFSFLFSCLVIWKVLIPLVLEGWSAAGVMFAVTACLTAVIMYLVAGWTRKGLAGFLGAMLGVAASFGLAHVFGRLMSVTGATMPFAGQLLYSGYPHLDLRAIFMGAIVLASSGAAMDLAMDIAAGVGEVKRHNAALGFRALLRSGLRIGRSVVGTMTTTLLLAYSGGYLTLLMVFAAQGTHPVDFLNSTLVSAELVKTLVGSFGLVLVAPFTALVAAALFAAPKRPFSCAYASPS